MVNGPGTVTLTWRVVCARRNFRSSTCTACLRRIVPDDARHRIRMTAAIERRAGVVEIHAFERGGETVRITLAADLAVGDDVEAGLFLRADGEQRGVVLRLFEVGLAECATTRARARAAENARPASSRSMSHSGCGMLPTSVVGNSLRLVV